MGSANCDTCINPGHLTAFPSISGVLDDDLASWSVVNVLGLPI